jgi:sortase B
MLNNIKINKIRMKLIIVLLGVFLLSASYLLFQLQSRTAGRAAYEAARMIYYEETDHVITEPEENSELQQTVTPALAALREVNPEIIGWIRIPDTNIDYPVVQGDDNLYYLDHSWDRQKSRPGAIFMDYRNNPNGFKNASHTILYGHHMRDQSMFHNLILYKDEMFFKENPVILISDLYETHTFEIFSAYVTTTDFYYIETEFPTADEYLQFLELVRNKSHHNREITLSKQDHLLTLSTCTYESNDARFVIHARRVEKSD